MLVVADVHPVREDRIILESPYSAKDLIRQVPGARWSKDDGKWSVPKAWTACLALRGIFGANLEIGDELSKWAWTLRTEVIEPAMRLREELDCILDPAGADPRLYPFQRAGVEFLALTKRALLADEMGSGKTVQTILGLRRLYNQGELDGPILIVCPNTMKHVWAREIETWWPGESTVVVSGPAERRRKQIRSGATWTIVNWEALRTHSRLKAFGSHALRKCVDCGGSGTVKQSQCEVHERELNEIEFAAVVADEAHRAKDPHSMQTRALRGATGDAPIRFGLTGTPISSDPTELWPILNWMDPVEWPAKSAWVERLIAYSYNIWGGQEINGIKPGFETEFHAGVDPRMRRMTKAVVLPFLPPIVHEVREVEMNPQQKRAYETMKELMVARLDAGVLMASNPMVQLARLMQLASSYGNLVITKAKVKAKSTHTLPVDPETGLPKYWNAEHSVHPESGEPMVNLGDWLVDPTTGEPVWRDEEHLVLSDPSSKLDALMGDLDDFSGQSTIVFAESRQLIEMLSARMAKKGIGHGLITGKISEAERDRTIEDFQKSRFPFVLCTIGAGGVGITLTQASVEVFIQRSWSPIGMSQAIARGHRIGSEIHDSITVIDYVCPGTAEMSQIAALDRKADMLEEICRDEDLMRKLLEGDEL